MFVFHSWLFQHIAIICQNKHPYCFHPIECVPLYGPPELSQSGMITQQQLRTSPAVAQIISLAILFLEFHKSEICFPIPTRSVGCGSWFKFISLFHPYH